MRVDSMEERHRYGRQERLTYYRCGSWLMVVGVLLMVILLPMSFSKVEYYEAGLLTQRSTGKVDRNKVYSTGRYMVGPDYHFKKFEMSAQNFYQRLSVWSKSSEEDAGSSLYIDVSFQYQLRKSKLADLYDQVALNYDSLIATKAVDAIKNTAPLFGVDEYLTSRERIELVLTQNVSIAINDVFADVIALQLREVVLTDEYLETRLAAAIQQESNLKEDYVQEATLVREETQLEVAKIDNEARAVSANADAQALVIEESANNRATQLVDDATTDGLFLMFSTLALNSSKHKASLDYITTLMLTTATDKTRVYINFDNPTSLDIPIAEPSPSESWSL